MEKEIKKEGEPVIEKSYLLSSRDVCKMFAISASTLYRLRTQNGLPFVKVEGRKNVMFSKKEIEEYFSKIKQDD